MNRMNKINVKTYRNTLMYSVIHDFVKKDPDRRKYLPLKRFSKINY